VVISAPPNIHGKRSRSMFLFYVSRRSPIVKNRGLRAAPREARYGASPGLGAGP
jgi:hypothetical protein